MFACSACWRNLISSLAADLPGASANSLIRQSRSITGPRNLRRPNEPLIRTSATLRGLSRPHHRRDALNVLKSAHRVSVLTGNKKRNATKGSPSYERAKQANAKLSLTEQGKTKLERQAEKEAAFLVDPLRLANTVVENLRDNNYEKAKALVIASDRHGQKIGRPQGSVNNVVSWNHLMDWLMAKHQPKDALKLFQDMKKRGHDPDAYTYTTLLRGLAENHSKMSGKAADVAVKIYNSIFQPSSNVKASTLITNAALTTCAKAHDMDALWSVAGRMPERGRGSADHWTYTTVLNAMQYDLMQTMSVPGQAKGDGKLLKDKAISKIMTDARTLWRDVVVKWRKADINIDEKLVSAMGRLLMTSGRQRDVLDVLALVKQTMGVHVDHASLEEARRSIQEEAAADEQADQRASSHEPPESENQEVDTASPPESTECANREVDIFDSVSVAETAVLPGSNATSAQPYYARPGNNVLSMLLEAAAILKKAHVGKAYWELLTDSAGPYKIEPDTNNCLGYMRLLRLSRSSRSALEMLQRDWSGEAANFLHRRGTFVIAMSTCVRNKLNPNIFSIASRMLDIMQDRTSEAREEREEREWEQEEQEGTATKNRIQVEMLDMDAKVLTMYLNLAMQTTKGVNVKLPLRRTENGDLDYEREASKNNTMRALHRLGPDTVNVLKMVKLVQQELAYKARFEKVPAASQRKMKLATRAGEKAEDLLEFLRAVVSACDRVLAVNYRLEEEGMGPLDNSILMEVRIQKAKMASYIESLSKSMGLQVQKPGRGSNALAKFPDREDDAADGTFGSRREKRQSEAGAISQTRERPLSRRQKQEKERQRRDCKMMQTMVRTGKSEEDIREERMQRTQRKPRAAELEDQDLWGREVARSFNDTFTELRA